MMTKDRLKKGMVIKYISSIMKTYTPVLLLILDIDADGVPKVKNLESGYDYGRVVNIEFFHKYNTPQLTIIEEMTRTGKYI